jgi:hypothetical protein
MDWARAHYGKEYAPNTRETFRRQTMHQFVQAGLALYNPDDPARSSYRRILVMIGVRRQRIELAI